MKYKLTTKEQADNCLNVARGWLGNQNPANMFTDCKSAATAAVAEYLANSEGLTLYSRGADRE